MQEDNISCADFEQEMEEKQRIIRKLPPKGIFEKLEYFDKLFPSMKI
jgi:hypothetical protein